MVSGDSALLIGANTAADNGQQMGMTASIKFYLQEQVEGRMWASGVVCHLL